MREDIIGPSLDELYRRMTVNVPEGESDGMRVEKFVVSADPAENMRHGVRTGRGTTPGTYTRLVVDGLLWMSDVGAEKRDHMLALSMIADPRARHVLINGLGLGMIVAGALTFPHVQRVDVVEWDTRVIELVGPTYTADDRVIIHEADAYVQSRRWPLGARWDVGWSDIWGDITTDDLTDMDRLNRAYNHRCAWHGCWGEDLLRALHARENRPFTLTESERMGA